MLTIVPPKAAIYRRQWGEGEFLGILQMHPVFHVEKVLVQVTSYAPYEARALLPKRRLRCIRLLVRSEHVTTEARASKLRLQHNGWSLHDVSAHRNSL